MIIINKLIKIKNKLKMNKRVNKIRIIIKNKHKIFSPITIITKYTRKYEILRREGRGRKRDNRLRL